jgi:hypothetical protein
MSVTVEMQDVELGPTGRTCVLLTWRRCRVRHWQAKASLTGELMT